MGFAVFEPVRIGVLQRRMDGRLVEDAIFYCRGVGVTAPSLLETKGHANVLTQELEDWLDRDSHRERYPDYQCTLIVEGRSVGPGAVFAALREAFSYQSDLHNDLERQARLTRLRQSCGGAGGGATNP